MMKNLANALDECLKGSDPRATAAQYPELEQELLPLIRVAEQVQKTPKPVPSPQEKARGLELGMMQQKLRAQTRQEQQVLPAVA